MLGTDGRLYDPFFDSNHDGKLDMYELAIMDDIVFDEDKKYEEFDDFEEDDEERDEFDEDYDEDSDDWDNDDDNDWDE